MKVIKVTFHEQIPDNFTGIAESPSGTKVWYKNGNWHREDGPALVTTSGSKGWYINNKLHRKDGPAIMRDDGKVEYWINGEKVSQMAQELYTMTFKE